MDVKPKGTNEYSTENVKLQLIEITSLNKAVHLVVSAINVDIIRLFEMIESIRNDYRHTIISMVKSLAEEIEALSNEDAGTYEEEIRDLINDFYLREKCLVHFDNKQVAKFENDVECRRQYLRSLTDALENLKAVVNTIEVIPKNGIQTGVDKSLQYEKLIKWKQDLESKLNAGQKFRRIKMVPQEPFF